MRPFLRSACKTLGVCVWIALTLIGVASAAEDRTAQSILQMLDYVAVDYAGAVENGRVKSADEYKEMLEFTSQIAKLVETLPANEQKAALTAQAQALAQKVKQKADAADVARASAEMRQAIIAAYRPAVAPKSAPDLQAGAKLYASLCTSCHGVQGRGDGPAAAALTPRPANFHDRERMAQRSVFGLYNTITLGVQGTAMTGYSQLSDDERWALAFLVAGWGVAKRSRAAKRCGRPAGPTLPNLAALTTPSASDEAATVKTAAIQAYLIAYPARRRQRSPRRWRITRSRSSKRRSPRIAKGDRAAALQLAITAYLEGFELVERGLVNIDEKLAKDTERAMMNVRALISRGAPLAEVEKQHAATVALLARHRTGCRASTCPREPHTQARCSSCCAKGWKRCWCSRRSLRSSRKRIAGTHSGMCTPAGSRRWCSAPERGSRRLISSPCRAPAARRPKASRPSHRARSSSTSASGCTTRRTRALAELHQDERRLGAREANAVGARGRVVSRGLPRSVRDGALLRGAVGAGGARRLGAAARRHRNRLSRSSSSLAGRFSDTPCVCRSGRSSQ